MNNYALDSNIVSLYLKGNTSVIESIENAIEDGHSIVLTPITYYEVKRGLLLINATKKLSELEKLCSLFPVGDLGDIQLEEAIKIYVQERKGKRNTEDADIFISVFCIVNDYVLVTEAVAKLQFLQLLPLKNAFSPAFMPSLFRSKAAGRENARASAKVTDFCN